MLYNTPKLENILEASSQIRVRLELGLTFGAWVELWTFGVLLCEKTESKFAGNPKISVSFDFISISICIFGKLEANGKFPVGSVYPAGKLDGRGYVIRSTL